MINIDKIPGFQKTPDEITSAYDTCIIFNIIDTIASENGFNNIDPLTRRVRIYKKLLDNQRGLLKMVLRIYDLLFNKPISKEIISETEIFILIEQVTGKSWEELNEIH